MKVIIADICSTNNNGRSSGHYFPVAQNYRDMFGEECYVAGGPIYQERFKTHHLALPYDHIIGESTFSEKWHELMNCRTLFKQAKGDIIVMQSVALLTSYISILLFYHKTSKLYFIQYYTESINSRLKRFLWNLIKHKVDGIICSSDRVGKAFDRPYLVITDYIYTKELGDAGLPYEKRTYDLCFVGSIFRDKGQVEAVKAFANKGLRIVVAGKTCEAGLQEELESISKLDPSIEMHLGYVSDEDYYAFIRNSRYSVLNYRGTYNDRSSGVVLDTIFNGTPILGHQCRALNIISGYGLGYIYDDITTVNINYLFTPSTFDDYRKNIYHFLKSQKDDINKLGKFLKR